MSPKLAYGAALFGYFGLLILWVSWITLFTPVRLIPASLSLTFSTLPLVWVIRGLLHDRRPVYIWLGLLSLVYFIHGVGATVDAAQRWLAILEIVCSLSLFSGSLARLKQLRNF